MENEAVKKDINEVKTIEVSSDNPDYTHISNTKSGIKKILPVTPEKKTS